MTYREPDTYQESLRCNEAAEWRTASCMLERHALIKRGVLQAMLITPGVKPLMSRYVCMPQEVYLTHVCIIRVIKGNLCIWAYIYVDDIIIACSELAFICEIKHELRDINDMSDMGALEHFLKVRVTRTSSYIQLNQSVYARYVQCTPNNSMYR